MNQEIIATDGGSFAAYLTKPYFTPAPGIIIIQEIFGVNEGMRKLADTYAQAGYLAIVPDLFWRQEPGVELTGETQEEWDQAFELYRGFEQNFGVEDLIATLNTLRNLPECNGKVGSIGFCLGGKLAYLMATRSDANCNVGYYGVGIEEYLQEADNIKNPLILHIAEEDQYVPKENQEKVKTGLANIAAVTIYSYPGVNHGFAREGSEDYFKEAANLANSRTLDFCQQYLKENHE